MDRNDQDDSDRDDSSQRAQYGDDDKRSEAEMPPQDEDGAPAPFGPRPPFPPQLRPPGVPITYNQILDKANQEPRARPLAAPMGHHLGHGLAVQGAAAAPTRAPYTTSLVAMQYTAKAQGIIEQRDEEMRRQLTELRDGKEALERQKQELEAQKSEVKERERAVSEREGAMAERDVAAGTETAVDDDGDGDEEMTEAPGNGEPELNQD